VNVFTVAFSAVFGLIFGSFLNVCIYRVPRDLSVVMPRSFCPECGERIAWFDNVPVFSFVLLRGRCRSCAERIPWRYPLVEIVTAALFAAVAARYGWTLPGLKWTLFEALTVVLFWTDLEERILPDEFTLGGSVLGLAIASVVPVNGGIFDWLLPHWPRPVLSLLIAVLCASAFALPFWLLGRLYERVRQADAFGLGDVKLLALLGVFLGWNLGVNAMLIGFVSGAVGGLVYAVVTRRSIRTTSLPLGAFLCFGAAIAPLVFGK